jgi:hypothetical protein
MTRRNIGIVSSLTACGFAATLSLLAACQTSPQSTPRPAPAHSEPAPADFLRATAARYAAAKTYRDAGRCTNEFTNAGADFKDTKPFTTAFERGGRLRFQFFHARAPGGDPTDRFTLWSTDAGSFEWDWTMRTQRGNGGTLKEAMVRPTSVSGGATRVAFPILTPDSGLDPLINLENPVDLGREPVNGVDCRTIRGSLPNSETITLWIDADHLIRKAYIVQAPDPSLLPKEPGKPAPLRATSEMRTTIMIDRPQLDVVIPAWAFDPPPAAPSAPAPAPRP